MITNRRCPYCGRRLTCDDTTRTIAHEGPTPCAAWLRHVRASGGHHTAATTPPPGLPAGASVVLRLNGIQSLSVTDTTVEGRPVVLIMVQVEGRDVPDGLALAKREAASLFADLADAMAAAWPELRGS